MAKVPRVERKGKAEVFRQVDRLDRTQWEKLAGEVSKDNLARQEAQHNNMGGPNDETLLLPEIKPLFQAPETAGMDNLGQHVY